MDATYRNYDSLYPDLVYEILKYFNACGKGGGR